MSSMAEENATVDVKPEVFFLTSYLLVFWWNLRCRLWKTAKTEFEVTTSALPYQYVSKRKGKEMEGRGTVAKHASQCVLRCSMARIVFLFLLAVIKPRRFLYVCSLNEDKYGFELRGYTVTVNMLLCLSSELAEWSVERFWNQGAQVLEILHQCELSYWSFGTWQTLAPCFTIPHGGLPLCQSPSQDYFLFVACNFTRAIYNSEDWTSLPCRIKMQFNVAKHANQCILSRSMAGIVFNFSNSHKASEDLSWVDLLQAWTSECAPALIFGTWRLEFWKNWRLRSSSVRNISYSHQCEVPYKSF